MHLSHPLEKKSHFFMVAIGRIDLTMVILPQVQMFPHSLCPLLSTPLDDKSFLVSFYTTIRLVFCFVEPFATSSSFSYSQFSKTLGTISFKSLEICIRNITPILLLYCFLKVVRVLLFV